MSAISIKIPTKQRHAPSHWGDVLQTFVRRSYGKQRAAESLIVTGKINALRQSVIEETTKERPSVASIELTMKYVALVEVLEARLPFSHSASGSVDITFSWQSSLAPSKYTTSHSTNIEKAACVFNCAALYSSLADSLASQPDAKTTASLKQRKHLLSCSAGIFDELSSICASLHSEKSASGLTEDLTMEFVAFASSLMLAQAQECVYEAGGAAGMKDSTLVLLAKGTCDCYEQARAKLTPLLKIAALRYLPFVSAKALLHKGNAALHAASVYRTAVDAGDAAQIGAEIYRLKETASDREALQKHFRDHMRLGKDAAWKQTVRETLEAHLAKLDGALGKAVHENETMYYTPLPASMPALSGKTMARAVPFAEIEPMHITCDSALEMMVEDMLAAPAEPVEAIDPPAAAASAEPAGNTVASWSWQNKRTFNPFPAEVSAELEAGFQAWRVVAGGEGEARVSVGGGRFVDFKTMRQCRDDDEGKYRNVRRTE